MRRRRVCWLAAVWLLSTSTTFAAEPMAANQTEPEAPAPDGWSGKIVMAKSPEAALRERPAEDSPPLPFRWGGISLKVKEVQRAWLHVDVGWVRAADVVPEDRFVEYFTSQLAHQESAYSYLGRARGWLRPKDFDKAAADVSEALRLEPRNARAYYVHARIASAQNRPDDELADCDRGLEIDPRDAALLKTRGLARSARGDYERAIQDFGLAIELQPHDSWARGARGYCWAEKAEYDKALEDFNAAIALNPKDTFALSRRAAVHALRREMGEAIADATAALRFDPTERWSFATRGAVFALQGKLDEAMADLNEAIRLGVFDSQTYGNRGRVRFLKGDFDAAVLDYTQAISLKGDDAELYYRRAEVWEHKGDNTNAIADLGECLRLAPQVVEAYVHRGRLRMESEPDGSMPGPARLGEALDDFQQALRLNPRHVNALIHRAHIWSRKNELQKAMDDLAAAVLINPHESEAYRQRAGIHTSRREYDLAIEDLTAGIQAEPAKTACLLDRAAALALKGEYQKAIDDCQAVLKMQPNNKLAYFRLAMAYSLSDRNEEALEAYSAVLRIDPDDAHALLGRGSVAHRLSKFDLASADFERLLQFDEHKVDAYRLRGQLWLQQREYEKALADLNEAIRLKSDDDFALCHRAQCWIGLKRFDKAIEDADEALRLNPKSDFASVVREWAVRGKNDPSSSADPFSVTATEELHSVTVHFDLPSAPSCYINLQAPAGLELALEGPSEQFGPQTLPVPLRLPMREYAMFRFKLMRREASSAQPWCARLEWGHLSKDDAELVRKAAPSLPLTTDDLAKASSGTDVIKVLVLIRDKSKQTGKPEFEVLTSTPTKSGPELVADAARRGAAICALFLSQRLPEMRPLLQPSFDGRFVRFSLRGPHGLMLAHESEIPGKFNERPQPVPAEFAFPPGIEARIQLTGVSVPAAAPVYGLFSVSRGWAAELGPLGSTNLSINITEADLEAVTAGKPVTYVIYFATHSENEESPSIETLKSTALPPESDPVAEASRRGQMLATFRLTKELPAVPFHELR